MCYINLSIVIIRMSLQFSAHWLTSSPYDINTTRAPSTGKYRVNIHADRICTDFISLYGITEPNLEM